MAEINLLQTNNSQPSANPIWNRVLVAFAVVLLLAVGAAYMYVRYANTNIVEQIASEDARQQEFESSIKADKNYSVFLSAQEKVKVIETLLSKHVDWAKLLPTFGEVTYKDAVFSQFSAESRNFEDAQGAGAVANITGSVSSLRDLDKLVKGMLLKDFSNTIRDVKFVEMSMNDEESDKPISFQLKVTFNNAILHAAD